MLQAMNEQNKKALEEKEKKALEEKRKKALDEKRKKALEEKEKKARAEKRKKALEEKEKAALAEKAKKELEEKEKAAAEEKEKNEKDNPPELLIQTDFEGHKRKKYFEACEIKKLPNFKLAKLFQMSADFPVRFPVDSVKAKKILDFYSGDQDKRIAVMKDLHHNARATYPIVHETFLQLAIDFLEHKKKFGVETEIPLYRNMTILGLINRLLKKRAVTFFGSADRYILLTGQKGEGGWKNVGTVNQIPPLLLKNCLSYDEIRLSSLLCCSSPSFFINPGSRSNGGLQSLSDDFEEQGIVIGVVGCRFAKREKQEYIDMIVDPRQNCKENGYGNVVDVEKFKDEGIYSNRADFLRMFAKFYSETYYPTWKKVINLMGDQVDSHEYHLLSNGTYFVKDIYQARCKISAEILLLEANERGLRAEKKVFFHIVGFGLGTFQVWHGQTRLFLGAFAEAINHLNLPQISDIFFSWIKETSCGGVEDGEVIGPNEIKLHFGQRQPHDKLSEEDKGKLVVVTYAWDGNALPGNEFWEGMLCATGDPAQAASSQIAELQNPHINPMVCASNLRVACPSDGKIVTIQEYIEEKLKAKGQVEKFCLDGLGGL